MRVTARDSELIQMIDKRVGLYQRRQERIPLEERMLTNVLFWSGKPEFYFENGRVMRDVYWDNPEDEHSARYRVNLIRARCDVAVAKILGIDIEFAAEPPRADARSRELAELSNRIFDHIRKASNYERVQLLSKQQAAIYGSSIIQCRWDPQEGDPTRYYWLDEKTKTVLPPTMLSAQERADKDQAGLFEDIPIGDLSLSICSPFGFYQDTASRALGIPGCHWVATRHFVDIDRVAEQFDMDPKDIPPIEDDVGAANYDEMLAFMSNDNWWGLLNYMRPEEKRGKRTLYIEMWQRRDSKYKKGLRVCAAGGKILNSKTIDNPYVGDRSRASELPFIKDDWKPHPSQFWGVSFVEDLIIPAYYTNRMRSSTIAFAEAHGQPATYVDNSTGLDTDRMTSQVGRIYKLNSGSVQGIKIGPTPQQPNEVMAATLFTESDLNKLASQTEVQGEKLPGQIRSGAGMRAINEERFAGLSIPAKCAVQTAVDLGRCMLGILKLYGGDGRVIKYQGDDADWVVEAFDSADIINDIVVVGRPDVTASRGASEQGMLDAIQAGAFNPQFDRQTRTLILKTLNYGTSAEFFARQLQGEKHAERVIQEIIRDPMRYGQQGYPALEWQDHEAEMDALEAFMYSPEFDALYKQGPVGQRAAAVITGYWKQHQAFLQQQQLEQLQLMEATKGAPGTPGMASQPRPAAG